MKRLKCIAVAAVAAVMALSYVVPASAATNGTSASLSIAPKKNYVIEPGKSVKDTLTIRNLDTAAPLELSMRVIDFTFTGDGGTPKLFLAEDAPQTTWSLKPFMKIPDSISIPAGQTKTVDMSVTIPAGHGAGSYYSAIVYSSGTPGQGGNVGLNASGVTLAFVNVPGIVKENLKLEKFGAYIDRNDTGYVHFTQEEPLRIGYMLKNEGNVVEAPTGSITIKGLFGDERQINEVNPNSSLALIGQTRTFKPCIKTLAQRVDFEGTKAQSTACTSPGLWPGFYRLAIDLYYGQNGNPTKEVTGKSWMLYLPLWFVIVLIIVLLIVAWYIRKLVLRIRSGKSFGGRRMKMSRRK